VNIGEMFAEDIDLAGEHAKDVQFCNGDEADPLDVGVGMLVNSELAGVPGKEVIPNANEPGVRQGLKKLAVYVVGGRVRAGETVEGVIGRGDVAELGDAINGEEPIEPPIFIVIVRGGEMSFWGLRTDKAADTADFSASVCFENCAFRAGWLVSVSDGATKADKGKNRDSLRLYDKLFTCCSRRGRVIHGLGSRAKPNLSPRSGLVVMLETPGSCG
jgi:hypothetical protein